MKINILKNMFYLIAVAYVFLGTFFLDWSFRMVPFSKNASWYDIFVAVTIDTCFIAIGALLYIATFLAVRKKKIASILYNLSFWLGITVFCIVTILTMTLVIFVKVSSYHIGDVIMYGLLYVPFLFVYWSRKRLEK